MGQKNRPPIRDIDPFTGGRPGDYVNPETSFRMWMKGHEEEQQAQRNKISVLDTIGFVFVLCVMSAVIVWVLLEQNKQSKPSSYTSPAATAKTSPSTPIVLRKTTGKINSITDEYAHHTGNAYTKRVNLGAFFPRRYVTLNNNNTPFLVPRYVTAILTDDTLRAAKSVEIVYYDEPHYKPVTQLEYEDNPNRPGPYKYPFAKITQGKLLYYDVAGITVDGVTYMIPGISFLLDSFITWIIIILAAGGLIRAALKYYDI